MLFRTEFSLIAPDQAVSGTLVFIPDDRGGGDYGLVMEPPEARGIKVIRLRDLSHQFYNAYAAKPFLQLGRAEIKVDLSSSLPLDEFFPAGAFIVSPNAEGLYDPGHYTSGRGSLITLSGRIVEYEKGFREIGFARYKIGFMREDKFISVRRTSLVQDQQNVES